MKFLDSNVILYAYLRPKQNITLDERIKWRKKRSQEIIKRIEEKKETVLISTVHLGEILNILSKKVNKETSVLFLGKFLSFDNVEISQVSKRDYQKSLAICLRYNLEPNDSLAIVIMEKYGCREIYTFDSDFKVVDIIEKPLLDQEDILFGK